MSDLVTAASIVVGVLFVFAALVGVCFVRRNSILTDERAHTAVFGTRRSELREALHPAVVTPITNDPHSSTPPQFTLPPPIIESFTPIVRSQQPTQAEDDEPYHRPEKLVEES